MGLPLVSTSLALAVPQGWSRTVADPSGVGLAEKLAAAPSL